MQTSDMHQAMYQAAADSLVARLGITYEKVSELQEEANVGIHDLGGSRPPDVHPGRPPKETRDAVARYKEWLKEDKSFEPMPLPQSEAPREILVLNQLGLRHSIEKEQNMGYSKMVPAYMIFAGFQRPFSASPLSQLRRISLSQMLARKTHTGEYVLCRVITPCVRICTIETIVEDPDGDARGLWLYNFPTTYDCKQEYLDALFPIGTILAIREPTLNAPAQGRCSTIGIDSPSDIILIDRFDDILNDITWSSGRSLQYAPPMPFSGMGWKNVGNEHFKAERWLPAAIAYSHGLRADAEAADLRCNRAEAYLRLEWYSGASADARRVQATPGVPAALRDKAVLREAKAEYGRGHYDAAKAQFEEYKLTHPKDVEIADWVARCRKRQAERDTGKYDWANLFRQAQRDLRLDVAAFKGPIQVQPMTHRGGGRGIAATRDIKVGELLLVSKPFASVFEQDFNTQEVLQHADVRSGIELAREQSALGSKVIHKLYGNPELHNIVFGLFASHEYPDPPLAYPPPVSTDPVFVDALVPALDIDLPRLEAILMLNDFSITQLGPQYLPAQQPSKRGSPLGLYPMAALFNHACLANAVWHTIGDVMIVRAVRQIAAGEEITIPYVGGSQKARHDILTRIMTEECRCELCEDERGEDPEQKQARARLMERIGGEWGRAHDMPVPQLRRWTDELAATFAPSCR